jgi:integrase
MLILPAMLLKLLFNSVLKRGWSDDVIVRPKKLQKFPVVLSRQEILSILINVSNIKHRTILLTAYSSGLRISEVLNLKIQDIDSANMRIKVRSGKGGKDLFSVHGIENINALRHYWKLYRPTDLLFPGLIKGMPLAQRNIQRAFADAKLKAGITKPATVHTLRHSNINTTCIYLHLSIHRLFSLKSPLDGGDVNV